MPGSAAYTRWVHGLVGTAWRLLLAAGVYQHDTLMAVRRWVLREVDELPEHPGVRAVLAGHERPFVSPAEIAAILQREAGQTNRAAAFLREHNARALGETTAALARGEAPDFDTRLDMVALNRAAEGAPTTVRIAPAPQRIALPDEAEDLVALDEASEAEEGARTSRARPRVLELT